MSRFIDGGLYEFTHNLSNASRDYTGLDCEHRIVDTERAGEIDGGDGNSGAWRVRVGGACTV